MPDNNRRGRWKAPLPPDTAKEQPLQTTAYREGGDIRTPSLVTKDTKAYAAKAAAAGFDGPEAADDFDGLDAQTQENEPDIAAALALFGMDADIRTFSPLALAFLGDAVYSLIIRTSVLARGNRQAEKLHNETTRLVCAQKQAAIGKAIYDILTTEEKKVYRRGRNSHPMHHAKGASLEEYLQATALETLCGYLYLQGRTNRLMELIRTGLSLTQRRNGDPLI